MKDIALLKDNTWNAIDPRAVVSEPGDCPDFIQQSKAESMVARNIYVQSLCGWMSDRSICCLASGRPVPAQATGFSGNHPTGEGLLSFSRFDEAQAGVEEICRNYEKHCRAAPRDAEEQFDSDKVLQRLLEQVR